MAPLARSPHAATPRTRRTRAIPWRRIAVSFALVVTACGAGVTGESSWLPSYNTIVVLLGATLLGMNAGLVGGFSVLKGRALLGDVLSHAALPGLCAAFLFLQRRSVSGMLVGALAGGLLSVAALTLLRRTTRIKNDAAMGVARSVMFGLGIVLISYAQNRVTEASQAGLDSYILGKTAGMLASDVAWIAGVSAASLLTIVLCFKELRLASFDADFARVQGWPASLLELLQMGLVAVTTVVGLPTVGAVLIAAMLILPAATMRFWTERFSNLLIGSTILGGLIGAVGTLASARFSLLPAGPIIILTGTIFFIVSMLCAPRRGLTARMLADFRFRRALDERKLLTTLYTIDEARRDATWQPIVILSRHLGGRPHEATAAIVRAERVGLVERRVDRTEQEPSALRLTPVGRRRAATILRNERLWNAYVDGYPEQAHAPFDPNDLELAEQIPPPIREELEAKLRAAGRLPELLAAPESTS
jgi:manganese/zinc/iron transport system permease protein